MTSQNGHFEGDLKTPEKLTLQGWVQNDLSSSLSNAVEQEVVDPLKNFAHDVEWLASGGKNKTPTQSTEKKHETPTDLLGQATDFGVHGTVSAVTYSVASCLTQAATRRFGVAFKLGGTAMKVLDNRFTGQVLGAGIHDFYLNAQDMKGRVANAVGGATTMAVYDGANHLLPGKYRFTKAAAQPFIGAASAASGYYATTKVDGREVKQDDLWRASGEGAAFGTVFPIATWGLGKFGNRFRSRTSGESRAHSAAAESAHKTKAGLFLKGKIEKSSEYRGLEGSKSETRKVEAKQVETKRLHGSEAEVKKTETTKVEGKEVEVKTPETKKAEGKEVEVKTPETTKAQGKEVEVKTPETTKAEGKEVEVKTPESKKAEGKEVEVKTPETKKAEGKEVEVKETETRKIAPAEIELREPEIRKAEAVAVETKQVPVQEIKVVEVERSVSKDAAETNVHMVDNEVVSTVVIATTAANVTQANTPFATRDNSVDAAFELTFGLKSEPKSDVSFQSKYGMLAPNLGAIGTFACYAMPLSAAGGSIVAAHTAVQNTIINDESIAATSDVDSREDEKFCRQLPDWMDDLGFRAGLYSPPSQMVELISPIYQAARRIRLVVGDQATTKFTRIVAPSFSQALKAVERGHGLRGPSYGVPGVLGGFDAVTVARYEEIIGKVPELSSSSKRFSAAHEDLSREAVFRRYPFLTQDSRRQTAMSYFSENSENAGVGMFASGGSNSDPMNTDPNVLSAAASQVTIPVTKQ